MVSKLLDEAENVVPAPAIESGGMFAQLVENFVHLESRSNRFDQDSRADRALGNADVILRKHKDVVPQAGLGVGLKFRQVKVWAGSGRNLRLGVMEEEQSEIKQRTGNRRAVD